MSLEKLIHIAEVCKSVYPCEEHDLFLELAKLIQTKDAKGIDAKLITESTWRLFFKHMEEIVLDSWKFLEGATTSPFGKSGKAMLLLGKVTQHASEDQRDQLLGTILSFCCSLEAREEYKDHLRTLLEDFMPPSNDNPLDSVVSALNIDLESANISDIVSSVMNIANDPNALNTMFGFLKDLKIGEQPITDVVKNSKTIRKLPQITKEE